MTIPDSVIATAVVIFICIGVVFWIFLCLGGGVWIRRLFHCTTAQDEEARERRAANRRNQALAARMGDGTFVPRDQATVGSNIYNPWAAQVMVPARPATAGPYPKPPAAAAAGTYAPTAYTPGRGYPYQVGWVPPVSAVAAPPTAEPARTSSPPPAYFAGRTTP